MKKTYNYGFIEPKLDEKQFVLGSLGQSLPKVVIRSDRQWDSFLPKAEFQRNEYFDTQNCTAYGSENLYEILLKAKYGIELDFSERDLGIRAGTRPPGNDPHIVLETLRKKGTTPDSMLSFDKDVKTVEDYYEYDDNERECDAAASLLLKRYSIGHEWVINRKLPLEEQRALMKEALQYSPLGVAGFAWQFDGEKYIRPQGARDTHWFVIYGYYENGDWKAFDSYDYTEKRLDKNFGFTWVKRVHIEQRPQDKSFWDKLKEFFGIVKVVKVDKVATIATPPTPQQKLLEVAKVALSTEVTPRDIVPDEVACAETLCTLLKKIFPDFPVLFSTKDLDWKLWSDKRFERITEPQAGCIIISPRTEVTTGHTGIFISPTRIASNDSATGLFQNNYSYNSWIQYFKEKKGLRIYLYKLT